jgi:hypothetical protein
MVKAVFAGANRLRLPIVQHLWTLDPNYGKPEAEIFLNQILPGAPSMVVQIAHMAGAGSGGNDAANRQSAETRGGKCFPAPR